jgi:O-antigen/teichoic acid export membrane protein
VTDSDVTGGRLLRNTVANGLGIGVGGLLTVIVTPYMLHHLGAEKYGIWLLAASLTFGSGYIALGNLALPEAAIRFVAEARARRDAEAINEVMSTLTVFFFVLGLVLGGILAGAAGLLAAVLVHNRLLHDTATVVFLVVSAQVAVALPTSAFLALIEGTQHHGWYQVIFMGGEVLWTASAILAVHDGHGVVSLAVLSVAFAGLQAVASYVVGRRLQPSLRLRPSFVKRVTLKRLLSYGLPFTALRFLGVVYAQMDRTIIAVALSAAAVARYEVAYRVHSLAAVMLSVAPSAILPAAAYIGAAGDVDRLRRLYLRGTRYALAMALPVGLAAMIYARAIILAWVGPRYAGLTGVTRLFLVYPLLVAVHTIGVTMLLGLGRMRETVQLNALSVGVNLVVSVALVGPLGIEGVVIGTLVGYLVIWIPYTRLFLSHFEVDLGEWVSRVILPNLPGLAIQLLLGIATVRLVEGWDFIGVVLAIAVSCGVSLLAFWLFGMSGEERSALRRSGRQALGRVLDTEDGN